MASIPRPDFGLSASFPCAIAVSSVYVVTLCPPHVEEQQRLIHGRKQIRVRLTGAAGRADSEQSSCYSNNFDGKALNHHRGQLRDPDTT